MALSSLTRRRGSHVVNGGDTKRRTEQEGSHTRAHAKLQDDGSFLAGYTRSQCTGFSSLGSLRRRCELYEGRRRGRAPRWAMADVSRRCSLWRWGSMTQRKGCQGRSRALHPHLASSHDSAAQKGVPFLGLGEASHFLATGRQRWHRVKGPLSATIATLCELQWDQQGPALWTTLDGAQFSLVADGAAADPRYLRCEFSAAIDQQLWARAARHEQGKGSQQGVDWHATRLHLTRLRKRGQHKEANFLMAARLPPQRRSPTRPNLHAMRRGLRGDFLAPSFIGYVREICLIIPMRRRSRHINDYYVELKERQLTLLACGSEVFSQFRIPWGCCRRQPLRRRQWSLEQEVLPRQATSFETTRCIGT